MTNHMEKEDMTNVCIYCGLLKGSQGISENNGVTKQKAAFIVKELREPRKTCPSRDEARELLNSQSARYKQK